MKKLLLFVAVMAMIACNNNNNNPEPQVGDDFYPFELLEHNITLKVGETFVLSPVIKAGVKDKDYPNGIILTSRNPKIVRIDPHDPYIIIGESTGSTYVVGEWEDLLYDSCLVTVKDEAIPTPVNPDPQPEPQPAGN